MPRTRWIALIVALTVIGAIEIYVWVMAPGTESAPPVQFNPLDYFPHLEPGEVVPAFDAENRDGGIERIEYREGVKTLLFVLSATCGTCHKNIPHWNRIVQQIGEDVHVVGLLIPTGDAYARQAEQKLLASGELRFPTFRFKDEATQEKYKVTKVPQTLLLGPGGVVELCLMGELSEENLNEIVVRISSRNGGAS